MLSIGIVGLPNVGKSTLFNALTKSSVLAANYPFATIDPNVGIVPVPDGRLYRLAEIYKAKQVVPATIRFVDIAGLVAGASKGEGLGNQFLAHIRNVSAIIEVVRVFDDANVTRVAGSENPKNDISTITTELILADLETAKKRLAILEKEYKANPKLSDQVDLLRKVVMLLDQDKPAYGNLNDKELAEISDLHLLSAKPVIYLFNVDESSLNDASQQAKLAELVAPAQSIFICAKLESELTSLEDYDSAELRQSYGLQHSGLENLVSAAYDTLKLQSFLTAGEKEVKAWTIPQGTAAPQAAGTIHNDFERGFIAAEVVEYQDLINLGSLAACRAAGKIRTEGKNYVLHENDVVEFRFNV